MLKSLSKLIHKYPLSLSVYRSVVNKVLREGSGVPCVQPSPPLKKYVVETQRLGINGGTKQPSQGKKLPRNKLAKVYCWKVKQNKIQYQIGFLSPSLKPKIRVYFSFTW